MSLETNIMRRIYYAFAIRLITHPVTVHVALLAIVAYWLKELVFVARIWESLAATPVAELGSFVVRVVTGADSLTLFVTLAALTVCVSLGMRLRSVQMLSLSAAHTA